MQGHQFQRYFNITLTGFLFFSLAACGGDVGISPPPDSACNSITGLTEPLPACSTDNPCTEIAQELRDKGVTEITQISNIPLCHTYDSADHPFYDDGGAQSIAGIDGVTRFYCLYRPVTVLDTPLVIFMHPGGQGNADDVYRFTHLRQKAVNTMLSPGVSGFTLVSVQGRNLHYPTPEPRDGNHHDFFYRDLASPSDNPDIANLDAIIDQVVAQGGIDRSRIYITGWSNGAMFSHLYSIARYNTATPAGNKIAASATFSGGDPFDEIDLDFGNGLACRLDPYPLSDVPQFIVRRNCDAALACNDEQQAWFQTPAGHNTDQWLDNGSTLSGLTNLSAMTINGRGVQVAGCTTNKLECTNVFGAALVPECQLGSGSYDLDHCANTGGILNHARWPDGTRDGSNNDYEVNMLNFLSQFTNS